MLTEPISETIGATTYSLARTKSGPPQSEYSSPDESVKVIVSQVKTAAGRRRHTVETRQTKSYTDPASGQTNQIDCTIRTLIDRPAIGFSAADVKALKTGHNSALLTDAIVDKLYGGES